MSSESRVSFYTFEDGDNCETDPFDLGAKPITVQSQHQPISQFSPERNMRHLRSSQPDVFRRINSIVPMCREEDSIMVDEDDIKQEQPVLMMNVTTKILTQSVIAQEMEDSSARPSTNSDYPILPEEETVSYVISGSNPNNPSSEPYIKQLRSSTESQQSIESLPRRRTVTTQINGQVLEPKRISMFLPMKSQLHHPEIPEETISHHSHSPKIGDSFTDLPIPLQQTQSFNLMSLSQQQSHYQKSVSTSMVQQWAEELATLIEQYLSDLSHVLAETAQKQSFSFDNYSNSSASQYDGSNTPEIKQLILRKAMEMMLPTGSFSSITMKKNVVASPKFETSEPVGDDKHRAELEGLRAELAGQLEKTEIIEFRMMEYYNNEQTAKKAKLEIEKELKAIKVEEVARKKEIVTLNDFINNLTKDVEEQHQRLLDEKDELNTQISSLKSTNNFLEKVLKDKSDQIAKLVAEKEELNSEFLEQVKDRDDQLQHIQTSYLEISKNQQMCRGQINEIQLQLDNALKDKESLEREMVILQHKLESTEIRKKNTEQVREYEDKLLDTEKQLGFYRSKLDDLIEVTQHKQNPTYVSFVSTRAQNRVAALEQSFNLKSVQTQCSKENSYQESTRNLQETIPKPTYSVPKVKQHGSVPCSSLNVSVNRMSPRNEAPSMVSPFKRKPTTSRPDRTSPYQVPQNRIPESKVLYFPEHTVSYKGDRYQGMRHGRGKQIYPDGSSYQGGWQLDKKEGFGTLKIGEREVYSGHWHNDLKHGCGHLQNQNPGNPCTSVDYKDITNAPWSSYQGEFKEDQFSGFGVLYFPSGERFHGVFKNGKPNGKGTFYRIDNEILPGKWVNGRYKP